MEIRLDARIRLDAHCIASGQTGAGAFLLIERICCSMNSSEKKRYVSNRLLSLLAPYGFFARHGVLWKYSDQGQYVVCISGELSRIGLLNELSVEFGSFFAPIDLATYSSKRLALDCLDLAFYVRNVSSDRPLCDIHLSFEEQVESILSYFADIVLPLIPGHDDLNEFLMKAERLRQMIADAHDNFPVGLNPDEIAYAYLSLGKKEEALRSLDQYARQCGYSADYVASHPEIFRYDNAAIVRSWVERQCNTQRLIDLIQANGSHEVHEEMERRENQSIHICRKFFHMNH